MFLRTRGWRYLRAVIRDRRGARVRGVATRTDTTGVLNHVAVLPEHQGEGVGSLLIQALEDAARTAGCDRLVLVTRSDGLAPAYCRLTGWSYVGERCTPEGYWLTTFSRGLDGPRRLSGERAPDYMHFDTGYPSRRYRPVSG
ncbi:GNAT family N-acetyltransferase [Nocardioides sp. CF8]|uniref:GNAT family N-acetyltransferase n=2 Tax=Nocardioides TaxID=1839 RepID=UPI003FA5ACBF